MDAATTGVWRRSRTSDRGRVWRGLGASAMKRGSREACLGGFARWGMFRSDGGRGNDAEGCDTRLLIAGSDREDLRSGRVADGERFIAPGSVSAGADVVSRSAPLFGAGLGRRWCWLGGERWTLGVPIGGVRVALEMVGGTNRVRGIVCLRFCAFQWLRWYSLGHFRFERVGSEDRAYWLCSGDSDFMS